MTLSILSIPDELSRKRRTWLVTGCAGFIGSHLLETLLANGQTVKGIDNFDTGRRENLDAVRARVGDKAFENFTFVEGDVADPALSQFMSDVEIILHQAARGSVQRSIDDPLGTNHANVTGFLNVIKCACDTKLKALVYASSSSVYGDNPDLPKQETNIGVQLSPYAASKRADEIYAAAFSKLFAINVIGFRYFNVFGPRQNPNGPYAAVIPTWLNDLKNGVPCTVFGDGTTSRDFCHVSNVVQANLRAAFYLERASGECHVLNVGGGRATSLNRLYEIICAAAGPFLTQKPGPVRYAPFRPGDISHSLADITKASELIGYEPQVTTEEGLTSLTQEWLSSS
ncbi:MAG: NAD-dependent epimerase/dehydratase family protein [Deltaproteobacteria bacterium]|nr:NAD-dependent epimerase/dehydratase family protein [Deltaproteobacteria bacterium]